VYFVEEVSVMPIERSLRIAAVTLAFLAAHLLLWTAVPAYRYGLGVLVPGPVFDLALRTMHKHQIEDIPDVLAACVFFGGVLVVAVTGVVAALVKGRRDAA
jgi:hypothetical protein